MAKSNPEGADSEVLTTPSRAARPSLEECVSCLCSRLGQPVTIHHILNLTSVFKNRKSERRCFFLHSVNIKAALTKLRGSGMPVPPLSVRGPGRGASIPSLCVDFMGWPRVGCGPVCVLRSTESRVRAVVLLEAPRCGSNAGGTSALGL